MAALPEVLEVYLTAGEYDYLVKVAVNGTPLPPAEIKLGGAKGIADQNPVTFTKA